MAKKIASIKVIKPGASPDIDSDFHTEHRERAIEYVTDLYGKDNVSNIVTFGTMAAKGALKSMCTIYEIPFKEANELAALIPGAEDGKELTLADIFNPEHHRYSDSEDFRNAVSSSRWESILEGALAVEGKNKSVGVHACGIIISSKKLTDTIPLQVRKDDNRVITQWTYQECESLGLIKMDFLGLDTVDLIQASVENIMKNGKPVPNMTTLIHGDLADKKVYELFEKGETVGIFQFGSEMVRELLLRMKPTEFNDLAACTAVARPGPMGMLSHTKYADRKNGLEKIDYVHPDFNGSAMEAILDPTYGLCIPEGTKIFDLSQKKFVEIENLVPGVSITPSRNDNGDTEYKKVTNLVNTSFKDIVRINTSGGRKLTVSSTHPVLTTNGYVEAGKISPKDKVILNVQGYDTGKGADELLNENKAYILGALLGDGMMPGTSPTLVNKDNDLISEIKNITAKEFNDCRFYEVERFRDGVAYTNYVTFTSKEPRKRKSPVQNWLDSIGYSGNHTMYDKKIDDEILSYNNSILVNLLAGLWDTDGCVEKNGIHYTTTSKSLFLSVKKILLRLGVDFGETIAPYENPKRENRVAYRLHPSRFDFHSKIQPFLKSKKKRNANITPSERDSRFGYSNLEPVIMQHFHNWLEDNPSEVAFLSQKSRKVDFKMCSTVKILKTYLKNKGYNEKTLKDVVDRAASLGIIPKSVQASAKDATREVLSVEFLEEKQNCYDIEVEDNHNFFVENFVVHNCVYQEQVAQIANRIAGMTLQEGDDLRKAMGKKKADVMAKLKPKFIQGGIDNGFSDEAMTLLWDTLEPFAKYAFNKSHSVAYALNSYQSAFLKTHYPVEFMAALIEQNIEKRDKTLVYLQEAKSMGLKVVPPNINTSAVKVAPVDGDNSNSLISFGLGAVKSVKHANAQTIVDEREENGNYTSISDVVNRLSSKGVNKDVFVALINSGACDDFGDNRKAMIDFAEKELADSRKNRKKGSTLFDMFEVEDSGDDFDESIVDTFADRISREANALSLYLTAHPVDNVRSTQNENINAIKHHVGRKTFIIPASCVALDVKRGRGKTSYKIQLEDNTGSLIAYAPKDVIARWDKYAALTNVRKAVKKEDSSVDSKVLDRAFNSEIVAQSIPEVHHVMMYKIVTGGYGGYRIVDVFPLYRSHDGSNASRVVLPVSFKPAEREKEIADYTKQLKNIAKNNKGKDSLLVSFVPDMRNKKHWGDRVSVPPAIFDEEALRLATKAGYIDKKESMQYLKDIYANSDLLKAQGQQKIDSIIDNYHKFYFYEDLGLYVDSSASQLNYDLEDLAGNGNYYL